MPNDTKLSKPRQALVDTITELINSDTPPWDNGMYAAALPQNMTTGKRYNGRNLLALYFAQMKMQSTDPRWATFNQIKDAKCKLRKGSHGMPVELYKIIDKRTGKEADFAKLDEEMKDMSWADRRAFLRENTQTLVQSYTVFNGKDIEGIKPFKPKVMSEDELAKRNERIEGVIARSEAPISYDGNGRNYYDPGEDAIHATSREAFKSYDLFINTVAHEIGHSTGHERRLGRELAGGFGSPSYAREELVAEFSSLFTAATLGLDPSERTVANSGAYIKSWLAAIPEAERPDAILSAVRDASAASDYVCYPERRAELRREAQQNKKEKTQEKKEPAFSDNIKQWYTAAYPTDELGAALNAQSTFLDLNVRLTQAYDVIGVSDSAVRERVFRQLAELRGTTYNAVYDEWLIGNGQYLNNDARSDIEAEKASIERESEASIQRYENEPIIAQFTVDGAAVNLEQLELDKRFGAPSAQREFWQPGEPGDPDRTRNLFEYSEGKTVEVIRDEHKAVRTITMTGFTSEAAHNLRNDLLLRIPGATVNLSIENEPAKQADLTNLAEHIAEARDRIEEKNAITGDAPKSEQRTTPYYDAREDIEAEKVSVLTNLIKHITEERDRFKKAITGNAPTTAHFHDLPFDVQVDRAIARSLPSHEAVLVRPDTPELLQKAGFKNLPILITQDHIRRATMPEDEQAHTHGLSAAAIKSIPAQLESPVFIFDARPNKDDSVDSVVVVTDKLDEKSRPIIMSLKPDGKGVYNSVNIDTNFITSVYGRNDFEAFLQRNIDLGNTLYWNKEKSQALFSDLRIQFPQRLNNLDYDTIIRPAKAFVNPSDKKSQEKSQKKNEQKPKREQGVLLPENIPAQMKAIDHWCAFSKIEQKENGHWRKKIYDCNKGKRADGKTLEWASTLDPATWSSFDKAVAYRNKYKRDGVAFVLTPESGITCIDIDNCVGSDGKLNEFAQKVIDHSDGTYAEYSTSGTGIHIFYAGQAPKGYSSQNKELDLEVYDKKRFMSMTGNKLPGASSELKPANIALTGILQGSLKKFEPPKTFTAAELESVSCSDSELIERISKSSRADEFQRLMNGEILCNNKNTGLPDHSASDYMLCNIVGYFGGGDVQQVKRIIMHSGLYRPDKPESYYERTAQAACSRLTDHWKGRSDRSNGSARPAARPQAAKPPKPPSGSGK